MALGCGGPKHGGWLRLVAAQDLGIVSSKAAKTLDWPAAMQNKTPVLNEQGASIGHLGKTVLNGSIKKHYETCFKSQLRRVVRRSFASPGSNNQRRGR